MQNQFFQTILFTTNEAILEAVSKHDDAYEGEMPSDEEEDVAFERPGTGDGDDNVCTGICLLMMIYTWQFVILHHVETILV